MTAKERKKIKLPKFDITMITIVLSADVQQQENTWKTKQKQKNDIHYLKTRTLDDQNRKLVSRDLIH